MQKHMEQEQKLPNLGEEALPLEIEQLAEQWADSQYPDDANAAEWIAARNGYRQCFKQSMQKPA